LVVLNASTDYSVYGGDEFPIPTVAVRQETIKQLSRLTAKATARSLELSIICTYRQALHVIVS
jgi:hypothetical protein